ncbi:TIGR04282 family arsenosugar biosynthesis glycosyltransferase [Algoriphagus chordae]|uniref:Glycosyltransferase A (GT-A) superfamily protein (DUF2064 family) n=1 Tax=Algoriphagus chordae TaxID=237019 RepID=A0A2W7R231_9BACT|nr:TIGR04282 family arsenosugar biosynthesis glycosyltransferase [Algoriphagus chordae]PZX54893.1 hypothetical protein LV85_01231 [Algoriphagus chordae]
MKENKPALIIFQKNLILGRVKTRLAADIGDEAALVAYKSLLSYTYEVLNDLSVDKYIFYADYIPVAKPSFDESYHFELQEGDDLGERMSKAFQTLFAKGYDSLIIIGTDCAELTTDILKDSFSILEQKDAVIGPATDGGYYLLGMSKFIPGLFENIPWSTELVARRSKEYLSLNNLSCGTVPVLSDVDLLADWKRFESKLKLVKPRFSDEDLKEDIKQNTSQ